MLWHDGSEQVLLSLECSRPFRFHVYTRYQIESMVETKSSIMFRRTLRLHLSAEAPYLLKRKNDVTALVLVNCVMEVINFPVKTCHWRIRVTLGTWHTGSTLSRCNVDSGSSYFISESTTFWRFSLIQVIAVTTEHFVRNHWMPTLGMQKDWHEIEFGFDMSETCSSVTLSSKCHNKKKSDETYPRVSGRNKHRLELYAP